MLIFLFSALNSINVPPLKSIPKFKPLNKIKNILNKNKIIENIFAFLKREAKAQEQKKRKILLSFKKLPLLAKKN